MIHWILPLTGILFYCLTPKGCYKNINAVLMCLLIFIFGYEEHIIENNIYDSAWHDAFLFILYSGGAWMFHKMGGEIQLKLALVGAILSMGYGISSFYINPKDFYYEGVFITLTILQLLVASSNVGWATLYKKIGARDDIWPDNHDSGGHSLHSDKS